MQQVHIEHTENRRVPEPIEPKRFFVGQPSWLLKALGVAYENAVHQTYLDNADVCPLAAARTVFKANELRGTELYKELSTLMASPPTMTDKERAIFTETAEHLKDQILFAAVLRAVNAPSRDDWFQQAVRNKGLDGLLNEILRAGKKKVDIQNRLSNSPRDENRRGKLDREVEASRKVFFDLLRKMARSLELSDLSLEAR